MTTAWTFVVEYQDVRNCSARVATYGVIKFSDVKRVEKFIDEFCGERFEIEVERMIMEDVTPYIFKKFHNSYSYKELCDELLMIACNHIEEDTKYHYIDIQRKRSAKKIANWFLECKYNPKYKKCRDRLDAEYNNY